MVDEQHLLASCVTNDCRQFIQHWLALPRRDHVPHSRDFLDRSPVNHMPWVLILEVSAGGILCRFMGSELVINWQRDLTGQQLDERAFSWGPKSGTGALRHLINQPCGLYRTATITLNSGRPVEYEAVQLPLGVDAGRPSRIVAYGRPFELPARQYGQDLPRSGTSDNFRWLDIGAGVPQSRP